METFVKKIIFVLLLAFGLVESLPAQIDPYVLARRTFDELYSSGNEEVKRERDQVIRALLSRKYSLEGIFLLPISIRFTLQDGTTGIIGWGESVHSHDESPNPVARRNSFLYLKAPEGKDRIRFRLSDVVSLENLGSGLDIKDFIKDEFLEAESKNKLMVDLFNFSNSIGESGRLFQELRYSEDKVYEFKGNAVLFYDLDYSQQEVVENLFLTTIKETYFVERVKKDPAFVKVVLFADVRRGLLDKYIHGETALNIGLEGIDSDKAFIGKIFENNLENEIYSIQTKTDLNYLYKYFKYFLSRRPRDDKSVDELIKEKVVMSFIYDVYSSNTKFFNEVPETKAKILKFMDEFTNNLLQNELSEYLRPLSNLSTLSSLKDATVLQILMSSEKLTPQELELLKGGESFPSGLYYFLLLDLENAEPADKNLILSKLKLLEDKLLEAGCDYIDLGKQRLYLGENNPINKQAEKTTDLLIEPNNEDRTKIMIEENINKAKSNAQAKARSSIYAYAFGPQLSSEDRLNISDVELAEVFLDKILENMMSVDLAKFNLAMGMLFSKDNMNFLESVSDIYSGEKLQAFNLFFNSMNEYKAIVNSKGGVSSPNLVFKTNDKILKTATEKMRVSYSKFKGIK
jgi:hypothetical protein